MTSDLQWRKSSFSKGQGSGDDCVELAPLPDGGVAMQDSKNPGSQFQFTTSEMRAFILGAKAGEFDDLAGI